MTFPSFQAYIAEKNHTAVRLSCLLVAALMPAGVTLDLMTHKEHWQVFLGLRLVAAALAVGLWALAGLEAMRRHGYPIIVTLVLMCSAALELMIVKLEGARSPYYAGLNLVTLTAGLIFIWSGRQTLVVCLVILGMWLLPALREVPPPKLYGDFFNNLYFLTLTGILAVAANGTRYNLARREYEARTALAHATTELQASLERIRELDRLKSQFFANISHELRTPLTLIAAPTQDLLLRGDAPAELRGTLQIILRNTLRLHRLIDGLLDLAQLEAGRMQLRISPVDLRALVQDVVASFQPAADTMGLKLRLDLPPLGEIGVLGDAEKLEVVLNNLLGNAVKFTDRGGEVRVVLRQDPEAEKVEMEVVDTGPGIPETDQPHIFERFRRVESTGRKQGGAGIGLALVKELVELHGGAVSVRSRLGEGASFIVRLPTGGEHLRLDNTQKNLVAPARTPEVAPALLHVSDNLDGKGYPAAPALLPTPPDGTALRLDIAPYSGPARPHLLIAEDSSDLRRFLCDLLSPSYHVDAVADGREALLAVQRQAPDLLLADVMMPHLSGIELCHQVKSDLRTRAVPVILLTARGSVEETLEGFAHGADDYVVKPFNPRELLMRVAVQLKLRRLSAQVANAARLAAVGTLAAGVAHEIKNPLNAINSGVAALRRRSQPGLQAEVLDMVEECVARISDIATALTDHARPADGEGYSTCDLRQGIESTLRLLGERLRAAEVEVVRDYRTVRTIVGRPRQLNQVFLNLLDNALRASRSRGRIYIDLADLSEDAVVVRVRDEGVGIPREHQERIFDPFFTTRPAGEGTGLGLYLSRQIIEAHGGTLRVYSEPGRGTEFQVELPVRLSHKEAEPKAA